LAPGEELPPGKPREGPQNKRGEGRSARPKNQRDGAGSVWKRSNLRKAWKKKKTDTKNQWLVSRGGRLIKERASGANDEMTENLGGGGENVSSATFLDKKTAQKKTVGTEKKKKKKKASP